MSQQPEIRFPLDLPNVTIIKIENNPAGDYIITVDSTLTGTTCRECGREIEDFHGYGRPITLRHLPILDHKVWIRYRPKRYRCPDGSSGLRVVNGSSSEIVSNVCYVKRLHMPVQK